MIQGYSIQNLLQTKVKDESFDVDLLSQFELCLQFDENKFSFCVIDTQSNRCLLLESYNFLNYPEKTITDQLQDIFEDHHVLTAGFWKSVKICTNNKQFSLVPNYLYDERHINQYVTYSSSSNSYNYSLYEYRHQTPDSVNVFAANSKIIDWVKSFYPNKEIKIIHQTSTMIEGIMKDQQSFSLKTLYLLVQPKSFTLMMKNENVLEYCNTFSYNTPEELIFYLMFAVSTLQVNIKTSKLILLGDIDAETPVYKKIAPYFSFITFGVKPSYLKYGYVFDEVPDHHFFDLYSAYLC